MFFDIITTDSVFLPADISAQVRYVVAQSLELTSI